MELNVTDKVAMLYQQLLQQWNKRSAEGMAGLFARTGTLIGFDGSQLDGQAEIYSVLNEIFTNFPTAAYVSIIKEVRPLGDNAALLLSVAGMVAQGQSDISPEVNVIHSLTAVMEDGNWRVALFQNTPAAFHGRPELAEQLSADLRQVIGAAASQN